MRLFREPSLNNLLRPPLVLGVSPTGLMALLFSDLGLFIGIGNSKIGSVATFGLGVVGFSALRFAQNFSLPGWEEGWISMLEKKQSLQANSSFKRALEVRAPDLLTQQDFIREKLNLEEYISGLSQNRESLIKIDISSNGSKGEIYEPSRQGHLVHELPEFKWAYSLKRLPTFTDPTTTIGWIRSLTGESTILLRVRGLDGVAIKRQIETNRRRNFQNTDKIIDVDSQVSFEDATEILEGISRGDQKCAEFSLTILSNTEQTHLSSEFFHSEKNSNLTFRSATGLRRRFHRSFIARCRTIADLVPQWADPFVAHPPVLKTPRGLPSAFRPDDTRLNALHWLVVGTTGSGKSFFAGTVLKRFCEEERNISVIFVDHGRSFARLVRQSGSQYLEPESLTDIQSHLGSLLNEMNIPGSICGVELSELDLSDKKAAAHLVLIGIENLLKHRRTTHPVYVVLDECWNFIRDQPGLVQRAFREYRKLNGGMVALTQSLSDFVTDETGQSILQNAPIRVFLLQGEDLTPFRGALSLNDVELERTKSLRQVKGEFSECLIKTPFESYLARLYPNHKEYELLRTDNIREERLKSSVLQTPEAMC